MDIENHPNEDVCDSLDHVDEAVQHLPYHRRLPLDMGLEHILEAHSSDLGLVEE